MSDPALNLNGFTFAELFKSEGLYRLDQTFLDSIEPDLRARLLAYRHHATELTPVELSEFLIEGARALENFLIHLFSIEEAVLFAEAKTLSHNPVSLFKKFFVLRRAKKNLLKADELLSFAELDIWLNTALKKAPLQTDDRELAVALLANQYINEPDTFANEIEKLTDWCVRALTSPDGKKTVKNWVSFKLPERLDYDHLIKCEKKSDDSLSGIESAFRLRDGFTLTDERMNARSVQDEVNYCIYCHDHDGDFCSKGFPVKKNQPEAGFKKNPLDLLMTGCPLEEKISEMNFLKREGKTLAALAMVMVDNPMCPATGHRICNDCMKACIYQKQDPVNIPEIETRVLTDVLDLPWGVEIYDLLTRWNPLRQKQWVMKPYNNLKILIAGMGPAGFTLAHHLLLEGFAVVGFDGLKIEPLPEKYIKQPIYQFQEIIESLDERLIAGFGGVAEYGITVRWDKNFLKLIYISLMRKPYFQVFGSTRFGGTITVHDAFEMGFDHFAVAVGAGLPKALNIPGSLAPGMRQANDFLMALQLGNAAKKNSLSALQIRLPAVVIGGGLTGVDTATEAQTYYITQVEKTLARYEELVKAFGEESILKELDSASKEALDEFLTHGKAVRDERTRAKLHHQKPDFIKLIRAWGGVTIVYRRNMQESPAYTHNHEELQKAFEEGIYYREALEPAEVILNAHGECETLVCHRRQKNNAGEWETSNDEIQMPARSIFVATGTQPNIAYEFEHRGTFNRVGVHYQHYENRHDELIVAHGISHCKDPDFGPFTSYQKNDHRVSLVGDSHPVFHGNVVKAIASGMRTYPKILDLLHKKLGQRGDENEYQLFSEKMQNLFSATVKQVSRLAKNIVELTIEAPLAAKHFKPGHFYRLQNYETFAPRINDTTLQMEPLALVASSCNRDTGTLKFIVIEKGVSSSLCALLKVGEPVSLMGPTGIRAKISGEKETVLIIIDEMGLPFLHAYGTALRENGNRVICLALFNHPKLIGETADVIISSTPERGIDDLLQHTEITLGDIDRIYLITETTFLKNFQIARETQLKDIFVKDPVVHASVYSTMQCMLKGVCAQCLQWQVDPETGKRTKAVFACSWPLQPLEVIDLNNIDERQSQNRLQEILNSLWLRTISIN